MTAAVIYKVVVIARKTRGKVGGRVEVKNPETGELVWGIDAMDFDAEGLLAQIGEKVDQYVEDGVAMLEAAMREASADLEVTADAGYGPLGRSRYDENARFYLDRLTETGQWLHAEEAGFYMDNKSRIALNVSHPSNGDVKQMLAERFEIYETVPGFRHVMARLAQFPHQQGREVRVVKHSLYQPKEQRLLIYQGAGKILELNGGKPAVVDNPVGDIMFREQSTPGDWEYIDPDKREPMIWDRWLKSVNYSQREDCPFEPEEQAIVLLGFMLLIWLRSPMTARPLLQVYGEPGSGKTQILIEMGKLLIGPRFSVTKAYGKDDEKDFNTALVNRVFLVIDNVDDHVRWLQQAIEGVTTGATISTRILFENMKEGEYTTDVMLALTTAEAKHRRRAFVSRSFFSLLQEIDEKKRVDPDIRNNWIIDNRHGLLSELADVANRIITYRPDKGIQIPIRMVGAGLLYIKLGHVLDLMATEGRWPQAPGIRSWVDVVTAMLQHQEDYQHDFAAEEDPVEFALPEWLRTKNDTTGQDQQGRLVSATDLERYLREIAEKWGFTWWIKGARGLGHYISNNRTALERSFVIDGPRAAGGWGSTKGGRFYRIWFADNADAQASQGDLNDSGAE